MYLVCRVGIDGKYKPFCRHKSHKVARILADAARYRRPHWEIRIIFRENEDTINYTKARLMDAN
jgi:hypothetical protein